MAYQVGRKTVQRIDLAAVPIIELHGQAHSLGLRCEALFSVYNGVKVGRRWDASQDHLRNLLSQLVCEDGQVHVELHANVDVWDVLSPSRRIDCNWRPWLRIKEKACQ